MNPDLYAPHIVNISIPKFTSMNETQQQEIAEIGQQISKLKEAEVITDHISYHDIHHYTMIYVVLGSIGIIALV